MCLEDEIVFLYDPLPLQQATSQDACLVHVPGASCKFTFDLKPKYKKGIIQVFADSLHYKTLSVYYYYYIVLYLNLYRYFINRILRLQLL